MTHEVSVAQPRVTGFNRSPTSDSPSFILCVEYMLDNPMLSYRDLARLTGRSAAWTKELLKSDVFKTKLAEAVAKRYGDEKGMLRTELVQCARKAIACANAMLEARSLTAAELISILKELLPHINNAVVMPNGPPPPQAAVNLNLNAFVPSDVLQEARIRAHRNATIVDVASDNLKPLEVEREYTPRTDLPPLESLETADSFLLEDQTGQRRSEGARVEVRVDSAQETDKDVSGPALASDDTGRDH